MHAPGEALFNSATRFLWITARARLGVLFAALLLNITVSSVTLHVALLGVGVLLPLGERLYGRIWKPLLAAIFFVAILAVGLFFTPLPLEQRQLVALRILAGFAWVIWFGNTVNWTETRTELVRLHFPKLMVELLDGGIVHGHNLYSLLSRRYEAASLRLGLKSHPVRTTALVLSGGIEEAFDLGYRVEQTRSLRSAPSSQVRFELALTLKNASVAYSHHTVLCDLSLQLKAGEWLAVAGASGSGKSTLLKAIAGLLPTQGERTERLGIDLSGTSRLNRRLDGRVGMVFQNPDDQFFATTVLEDMVWGLEQRGLNTSAARKRSLVLLEALAITHLAVRPLHTLSFGEKKRAAFAATLVCNPELVLIDEPTIGLDPVSAHKLVTWLETYALARNVTVIWATHDLLNLPRPIRRVALLQSGHLVFDGGVEEGLKPQQLINAGLMPAIRNGVN